MSLINDALKQTKQSQPPSPPSNPPSLPPVESASQAGGSWLTPIVIILLLVAAGIFIGRSLSKHTTLAAKTPQMVPTHQVKLIAIAPPVATNVSSSTNIMAVVPMKAPEPKLQGILFDPRRPCAIVDGNTVFVGDQVGEFR
ncbi:MAG TPA: hypothetical protein VMA13_08865, partial [Candidatus Saccharimonadales bacterium]|nr:hypothetical protein [Candidatus Saccharimonadales bacterium]